MMNYMALTATASQWGKEVWDSIPAFAPERLELAWQVTLIGMLMIFAVLSILWAVLAVFKMIFAKAPKSEKPAKPEKPAPAKAPAPAAPVAAAVAPAASAGDAELVAILTAAVAAYMAEENPNATPSGFRVVSYRRANGGRPWNSK